MNTPALTSLSCAGAIPDLTDEQWHCIASLLPEALNRERRRGRPAIDPRRVLNGVMWVLRSHEPWSAMPKRYVPYQTAHRYYLRWKRSGVLGRIVLTLFNTDAMVESRVTRKSETRVL